MFRPNVGGIDRVLRVTLGPVLFIVGLILLLGKITMGAALLVVGLLAFFTGLVRFCVLYVPFGISTARLQEIQRTGFCDCFSVPSTAAADRDRGPVPNARHGAGNAEAATGRH